MFTCMQNWWMWWILALHARRLLNNRSEVASTVMKGAPGYCSVYTIAKGNKVASAREATHPLKSSLERMLQNNIPERKLISSASCMCRSRTQDEVILQPRLSSASGCSQGRLSTDSSLMGFYQNQLRSESGNCSPPRASSFSSYARKNGFNFTRGLVDSSFEQTSVDEDTPFSFSNDESRPNSLPSSPTTVRKCMHACMLDHKRHIHKIMLIWCLCGCIMY